jgi:uncharacterized protein (TIGR03435 family)
MFAPRALRHCALLTACVIAFARGSIAQPPAPGDPPPYTPTLIFDVASVRETQQPQDNPSWQMGLISAPHSSEFQANGITPKVLLQAAYGFGAYEVSGAPDWFESSFWVVQAKCDHSVDEQLAKLTDDQARLEKQHMMQALLADRFHLKVHWETKQANVLALTIAKGGSKLQVDKAEAPDPSIPNSAPPETKGANIQSHMTAQGHELTATHITAKGIAALLSAMTRANVDDRTGLPDRYNFTLHYTYQSSDADSYPSIFTAVQEQLGLQLERTRGSVDVLPSTTWNDRRPTSLPRTSNLEPRTSNLEPRT